MATPAVKLNGKFQWLSNEVKARYGLNECTELNQYTRPIYDLFKKNGYDMQNSGDMHFCEITPEFAEDILHFDTQNRKKQKENVRGIIGDLLREDFHIGPDAICFSKKGYILSGAQRLTSIKVSGKSAVLPVLSVFIDPFLQMDTGATRDCVANQLIKGEIGAKADDHVGAVVRNIIRYAADVKGITYESMNKAVREDLVITHYYNDFENWLNHHFHKKKMKACFKYLSFCLLVHGKDPGMILQFIKCATAKEPKSAVTKLEVFLSCYSEMMRNVDQCGVTFYKYVNIAKYAWSMYEKYYNKQDKCPRFPYKADNGKIAAKKKMSDNEKDELGIGKFDSMYWIDVSFIEGKPVRLGKGVIK